MCSLSCKRQINMVQLTKGRQNTLGTLWKNWTKTKTIWHELTWVLSRAEQSRQTWLGATISPTPDHIFTWNSHKSDSPWHREETLHRIFGKICTFGQPACVWTRAETNVHVFDLSWRARARPDARPHAPMPSNTRPCARTYKVAQGHDRTPRTPSASPEHEFAGVLSTHGVPSAARARPPWTGHSGPPPSNPAPWLASLEPCRASPSPQTERYFVGGTGLPSSDFSWPPPCVDQTARWAIFKFLAPMAPLTSREAPRALWLSSTAVSRPEHAPPTSSTACTRGQPSSGHHRRWSAPRRDCQRPSDLARPFAGPLPLPVSRVSAFSLLGYCSGEEGVWVREGKMLWG
jgi:hypothetical protein